MTVRFACYRYALRYIEKEYLSVFTTISIEECSPADASIDYETQYEIEDYTKVDTIIHQMRLTVAEEETLNYYMAGLGFVAIAQMQNVNNTTVWRRRKSMEYMARHHDDLLKTLNDEQKAIFGKIRRLLERVFELCRRSHLRICLPPWSETHNEDSQRRGIKAKPVSVKQLQAFSCKINL